MVQRSVLKMIALEPGLSPYSKEAMEKSRVSAGGIQKALKSLIAKDVVEKTHDGTFHFTDPVMLIWLR